MAITTTQKRAAVAAGVVALALLATRPSAPPIEEFDAFDESYPGPSWGSGTATWTPTARPTATSTPEPVAGKWHSPPADVWAEEISSFEAEWPESADALNNAKDDIEQRNFRHTSVSGDVKFQNGCLNTDVQIGGGDPDDAMSLLFDILGPADLTLQGLFERGPRLYTLVFWRGVGPEAVSWPTRQPTPNPTSSDLGGSHPDEYLADTLAITVGTFPVGDAIVTAVSDCGGFHESIYWLQEALGGSMFFETRW